MNNQETNDKIIWVVIAIVFLIAGIYFYNYIIEQNEYGSTISLNNFSHKRDPVFVYRMAEGYLDDELYEKAYEEFNKIPDFKDSKLKAQKTKELQDELVARYEKGKIAFENKDYEVAYKQLIYCGKYKRTKEMCKECDRIFFGDIDRELNKFGIEMVTCPSPDGIGFFRIGKYELTRLQHSQIIEDGYYFGNGEKKLPVAITFNSAKKICSELNNRFKKSLPTGYIFEIPSEKQWEYACNAGKKEEKIKNLDSIAWYNNNSRNMPHPVGSKKPNAWGIYDMIGNMWEFCDTVTYDYVYSPYSNNKKKREIVSVNLKGGSYCTQSQSCKASGHQYNPNSPTKLYANVGFRLALVPVK